MIPGVGDLFLSEAPCDVSFALDPTKNPIILDAEY
jgi:hypothetical protein